MFLDTSSPSCTRPSACLTLALSSNHRKSSRSSVAESNMFASFKCATACRSENSSDFPRDLLDSDEALLSCRDCESSSVAS